MKTNTKHKTAIKYLAFAMALTTLAACKKDHTTQTQPLTNSLAASMVHIESYGTATLNFSYNPDSTLKAITASGYQYEPSLAFSYVPNTIMIQRQPVVNGSVTVIDSVTLTASGRLANVRHFSATDKSTWGNDRYTRNSSDEIVQIEQGNSNSDKTGKFPFTYVNGNIIHDQTAAVYQYDLSKPAQFGDHHSLNTFLNYGVRYPLSKNLVTAALYGRDTTFYKYTYDKSGRITESDVVQDGKTITRYQITYK